MPRRMSFSKTLPQMRSRTKDVTRRFGWRFLQPGDVVTAIEKGMGLRKGEKHIVLYDIEIVSVRREPLGLITADELRREGFPGMTAADFFGLIGGRPEDVVTRIEFREADRC